MVSKEGSANHTQVATGERTLSREEIHEKAQSLMQNLKERLEQIPEYRRHKRSWTGTPFMETIRFMSERGLYEVTQDISLAAECIRIERSSFDKSKQKGTKEYVSLMVRKNKAYSYTPQSALFYLTESDGNDEVYTSNTPGVVAKIEKFIKELPAIGPQAQTQPQK